MAYNIIRFFGRMLHKNVNYNCFVNVSPYCNLGDFDLFLFNT